MGWSCGRDSITLSCLLLLPHSLFNPTHPRDVEFQVALNSYQNSWNFNWALREVSVISLQQSWVEEHPVQCISSQWSEDLDSFYKISSWTSHSASWQLSLSVSCRKFWRFGQDALTFHICLFQLALVSSSPYTHWKPRSIREGEKLLEPMNCITSRCFCRQDLVRMWWFLGIPLQFQPLTPSADRYLQNQYKMQATIIIMVMVRECMKQWSQLASIITGQAMSSPHFFTT